MKWAMVGCAIMDAAFAGMYLKQDNIIAGVCFVALSIWCSLMFTQMDARDRDHAAR